MRTRILALALPAAAIALLGGCATPAYVSPVEVTRFVSQAPTMLGQGTIRVTGAPGMDTASVEYGIYADAVRAELAQLGYRVTTQEADQVAQISLEQMVAAAEGRRGSGVGVGGGASTGTYGSGVGVGVGVDLTRLINGRPAERIERQLAVSIRSATGVQNLWEGRASMTASANSDYGSSPAAAARMADALFTGFPGESGETISVE
ncbi:DUF4136 domain-containing protein [Aurantiacibacter luteus]|uniref:DUF4136 domain-containing protein n=1 Tax=Aurantiacibacter luteus TaxID=1581420 RepID=A0A0G9MZV3_9SPHN|nr:DUF4136 domain-containing protein [Aurantiacibacter luteus]KLE34813.1 hypothetical protein AAW00_07075 [Aurantiacibacter luteus]